MDESVKRNIYRVEGFTCTGCAATFEKNVKQLPHVQDAQVNFGAAKLTVVGEASIAELEKAGAFEGLKIYPESERSAGRKEPFWHRKATIRTAISALLLLTGWLLGAQYGDENSLSVFSYGLSILIGGYTLFLKGVRNLVRLQFDMNTLMTVAILGAAAIGEWGEGAMVVFLFAISEALESYSMDKARESIRSLVEIAPNEALIRRNDQEIQVPVDEVRVGEIMIVKPGQKIAMDGKVITGASSVNQAAITGESVPVTKDVDDEVYAGTLNQEGLLEVSVTKRFEDTTLAKIIHLVEEAQAERAPSQAFVDRFASVYTPLIMLTALAIAVLPPLFAGANWAEWIYRGLAVLVVGCPCALVISTPVAVVTAIGTAARNGVLIKGGIHLEEAGRLSAIAFDKTGTLTKGVPTLTDIKPVGSLPRDECLIIAAAIERGSQHPLASAIIRQANHLGKPIPAAESFVSLTGKGAKAVVNSTLYHIGSPRLFEEILPGGMDQSNRQEIATLQEQGKTVMLLGTKEEIIALFAVADEIRETSKQALQKLHQLGIGQTVMLTGDHQATAAAIAQQLDISDVDAGLLPQDKREAIKRLINKHGHVAMVGDGINDAPALATATVSFAMGGAGSDTALETADIALMSDDLSKLPFTIALSRRALAIIKQNITFSLAIKAVALLLIFPGWLTLWMAIFADMGATLLVTLNALRLLRITN
ncbi:cadmium-translocating P-type ATPase [Brevibacillus humidisoli]|uniref:heavy metal translocating P-type ATPase n=1 Tax=Brevibacillus humidisoli TaxID=2895522 RepID=UPI001E4305DD|nr:heavy metal translocating P-type ATPase [Brevibacillus humidisoli]UFJ41133.1 cadmium-translocating P-type ATPase [Brevibacillus humidisoli]